MLTRLAKKGMDKNENNDDSNSPPSNPSSSNPSNQEIWKMLVNIQKDISKLLSESQQHRRMNEELKQSLDFETSKRENLEVKVLDLEKKLHEALTREKSKEENEQKLDDL